MPIFQHISTYVLGTSIKSNKVRVTCMPVSVYASSLHAILLSYCYVYALKINKMLFCNFELNIFIYIMYYFILYSNKSLLQVFIVTVFLITICHKA